MKNIVLHVHVHVYLLHVHIYLLRVHVQELYLHVYTCLIRQILGKNMCHKTNDVQVHCPTSIISLFDNLGIIKRMIFQFQPFNYKCFKGHKEEFNLHVRVQHLDYQGIPSC